MALNVLDVFCGCGGLSYGVVMAGQKLRQTITPIGAIDVSQPALSIYSRNFTNAQIERADALNLVDFQITRSGGNASFVYPPELINPSILNGQPVDVLIGGPPCQGNSNLNNRTRRTDPKNLYYLVMPAMASALQPSLVIIENVPEVLRSNKDVVNQAEELLKADGYYVTHCMLNAENYGVPQKRKRHFLLASKNGLPDLSFEKSLRIGSSITAGAALSDIADCINQDFDLDTPAVLSDENKRRINFLFDNDLYDLPNSERPECHKAGHTYPSVYGRMYPDAPAQTITGGFLSPGRGRYIHPYERRGLTLREGAVLQSFPSTYKFKSSNELPSSRTALAQIIGDAVPPLLAKVATELALNTLNFEEQDRKFEERKLLA